MVRYYHDKQDWLLILTEFQVQLGISIFIHQWLILRDNRSDL